MQTGSEQPAPARHRERATVLIAGLVGLALVAVMITRTSAAVFNDTTANTGNYFHGGTVVLDDNDSGSAMFEIDAMDPGESYTRCIEVTYSGTITSPSAVKVYMATGPTRTPPTTVLDQYIDITIERATETGPPASPGDCDTFGTLEATPFPTADPYTTLSDLHTNVTDYASGVGTWIPSATPESRLYRITAHLRDDVPTGEQDAMVSDITFTWEIQS